MRRFLFSVAVLLLLTAPVLAQTGTPNDGLGFDQAATNLATANAYVYRYYADAAAAGVVLPGVVCTGAASPYACRAPFPAFSPGVHTVQITAGNAAGESVKSVVFSFTFVVQPSAPVNLKIVP